jgi:hypothetical protein
MSPYLSLLSSSTRFVVNHKTNEVKLAFLTPFQGADSHRVYGHFECITCPRSWQSAATYKNKWQKCKGCEQKYYPYYQKTLDQREHDDGGDEETRAPHDATRCQRCLEGQKCFQSIRRVVYREYDDSHSDRYDDYDYYYD